MSLRRRRSKRLASAAKERPEDAEWSNLSGDDDGDHFGGSIDFGGASSGAALSDGGEESSGDGFGASGSPGEEDAIVVQSDAIAVLDEDDEMDRVMALLAEHSLTAPPLLLRYFSACDLYRCKPDTAVCMVLSFPERSQGRLHLGRAFSRDGLLALAVILKDPESPVRWLDCQGTAIGSTGCLVLQDILESPHCQINHLDLSYNKIDSHGGAAIGRALAVNTSLKVLNLRGNVIESAGAEVIAQHVGNPELRLRHLDVSNNLMGFRAVLAMSAAAPSHLEIDFSGNYLREEILNAATHLVGAILAVIGGIYLFAHARSKTHHRRDAYMWSSLLYVVSLCTLYASSTLAHSFFRMRTMGRVFQIMDHASIYLLIAGSYGPFTLVSLGDVHGSGLVFSVVWVVAVVGVFLAFLDPARFRKVAIGLYLFMGWVGVIAVRYIYLCMDLPGFLMLAGGGLFYTVGVFFYIWGLTRPIYHALWHVFVLFASAFHYFAIYYYVEPCDVQNVLPGMLGVDEPLW